MALNDTPRVASEAASAILNPMIEKAKKAGTTPLTKAVFRLADAEVGFPGLRLEVGKWLTSKSYPHSLSDVMNAKSARVYYFTRKLQHAGSRPASYAARRAAARAARRASGQPAQPAPVTATAPTSPASPAQPSAATATPVQPAAPRPSPFNTPVTPSQKPKGPWQYVHRFIYGVQDFTGDGKDGVLGRAYWADPPVPLLICGGKGCGKTTTIHAYCKENNIPYERVNLNGGTTTEDLLGHFMPNKDGIPVKNPDGSIKLDAAGNPVIPQFVWSNGLLVRMIRNGGCLVLDELNAASPEFTFCLHSLIDDERRVVLTLNDGETVYAHPRFWLCTTYNPDYAGTRQINPALKDRFGVQIIMDNDLAVEEKLLWNKRVFMLAKQLRSPMGKEKFGEISTRSFLFLQDNIERFGSTFAFQSFINSVANEFAAKEVLTWLGEIAQVFESASIADLNNRLQNLGA